jgi:multiple sugar transport system substrate-binding protein
MDSTLGRRDFLKISGGMLAGIGALGLAGCGNENAAGNGKKALQFTFWGSTTRATRTDKAVQLYQQLYPQTTIGTQFTDFNSYWPKLATQISGGSAPDLIQMDMRFIDQYQKKGLLLDLSKFIPHPINLPDFNQVLLKGSEAEGVIYGIPFGGNFLGILYDKNMLQKAGVEMPEQARDWTWDGFAEYTLHISKALGPGVYGTEDASANIWAIETFIRQRGKELYTSEGQRAFSRQDAFDWFAYWDKLRTSGACATPAVESESSSTIPALSTLAQRKAAINFSPSNLIQATQAATPHTVGLFLCPSTTGLRDNGTYLKASMLMSASATTQYPDEVATFINFLFANNGAIQALGIERGIPGSARAQALLKPSLQPSDSIQLNLVQLITATSRPKQVLDPPGAGEVSDLLTMIAQGLSFGKLTAAEAADTFVAQTDQALERVGV